MQGSAHEPTRVDATADLRHGAECAGEPEVLGDDGGELDRRGRDQPDALPRVEVLLGQRERALAVWKEGQMMNADNETLRETLQRFGVKL